MQIKEFYLDLREWPQYGKKTNQGWMLYTEAFKKPLKFVFWYEQSEVKSIETALKKIDEIDKNLKKREEKLNDLEKRLIEKENKINEKIKLIENNNTKQQEKINIMNIISEKERNILNRVNDIWKAGIETNKSILNKIENIKKEAYVYNKKFFVNWEDTFYGEEMQLPSWNYVIIKHIEVVPINNNAIYDDTLSFEKIHIENSYIPEVNIFGKNSIDNPAAQVMINILFFPVDN